MIRKISRYDCKHLDTLAEMLTNKGILARVYSQGFNESDIYIIILGKALKDKDFLRWWKEYAFKINLYKLNK